MATAKKNRKQPAVKDLKPRDAQKVKGGDTAKPQQGELHITKQLDSSSPTLMK